MELASVFLNGVRSTPKLDPYFSWAPQVNLFVQAPRRTEREFNRAHINRLDCSSRRIHYSAVVCSRSTEKEDGLSTSEDRGTDSHSKDSTDCDNISHTSHLAGSARTIAEVSTSTKYSSSIKLVSFWVCTALAFGVGLGWKDGVDRASEFFAGYLLEQSLSVDNLFVFVLIFKFFKVPSMYQSVVLSYGIAGAIIFRLSIILLGTATLQLSEAVYLLFAGILLFSSFKLFTNEEDDTDLSENFVVKTCRKFIPVSADYDGNKFFTFQDGVWKATPLLLTLAVIELSDIAFAVDSIPAVLGVTRDPFIVFTSNIFAILGLRSLYVLISESMTDLEYLQPSIGVVLAFIGSKMIFDYFGLHVPTEVSLGFVATTLGTGVVLSLVKKSH